MQIQTQRAICSRLVCRTGGRAQKGEQDLWCWPGVTAKAANPPALNCAGALMRAPRAITELRGAAP